MYLRPKRCYLKVFAVLEKACSKVPVFVALQGPVQSDDGQQLDWWVERLQPDGHVQPGKCHIWQRGQAGGCAVWARPWRPQVTVFVISLIQTHSSTASSKLLNVSCCIDSRSGHPNLSQHRSCPQITPCCLDSSMHGVCHTGSPSPAQMFRKLLPGTGC